jgi:hypothetical protein
LVGAKAVDELRGRLAGEEAIGEVGDEGDSDE